MSRALEARTRVEYYGKWAEHAREGGVPEKDIAAYIEAQIEMSQELLAGKCPSCGAKIERHVNYSAQQGPSSVPGAWVMYRCSTQPPPGKLRRAGGCDFMIDLVEGDASN